MAIEKDMVKELLADIKSNNIKNLYLFHGEESYLREHYLSLIQKLTVDEAMSEFNLTVFVEEVEPDELSETIDSYPAMSEKKLVIVRDVDVFKKNEEYRRDIETIISDIPEYCCVVFVFTSQRKIDRKTKLYQAFAKYGNIIEFKRAGKNELTSWIKRRFAALNREISDQLCDYLMFYCGSLMQGLIPEIEKVGAFSKGRVITREDIDAVASPNPEAVIFDLTNAIAKKEYNKAMEISEKLKSLNEEPIAIIALISRQLRQIYTAQLALEAGKGIKEIMVALNMKSEYPAKLLMQTARQVDKKWSANGIKVCLEADAELKLGGDYGVVQYVIAYLSQKGGEN